MLTALLVIAILVVLIVGHELGHFVAAKIFGVRVDEFGVGYPPRAFLFGKVGDTEYTLNWIPFGGFVRLYGEEESAQHGSGSLADAPHWKQAIILVAGVAANALIAWALFVLALHIGIPRAIAEPPADGSPTHLIVSDVVPGSPASASGLAVGDEIVSIADAKGTMAESLVPQSVTEFVRAHPGEEIDIGYRPAGSSTIAHTTARPAQGILRSDAGAVVLGVGLTLVTTAGVSWGEALVQSVPLMYREFVITLQGLWGIISTAIHGAPDISQVVGPVGLAGVVGEAARGGWGQVLLLAGLISVNLAIINLVPIPVLDGGRLVVVAIESIFRRPSPKLVTQILNTIGIALILLLMVAVTWQDIARLIA